MSDAEKKQEVKETSEEREERHARAIREIEKREAINFPKLNYKWYQVNENIVIEVYIKELP